MNRRIWFRKLLRIAPRFLRHRLLRSLVRPQYELPPQLTMKIAETREELTAAYRILHDAYVDEGYMTPDPTRMRITKYFALPSTTTLIALWEDKVIGTMSIIRRTGFGLPIEGVFDLGGLATGSDAIAEVSSLAIDKEFRHQRGALLFPLCRFFYDYSLKYLRLNRVVIAVHPKMADLYEGILGFKRFGKMIGSYGFANGNPAVGLWADLRAIPEFMSRWYSHQSICRNLYHFFFEFPIQAITYPVRTYFKAADPVMTLENFRHFFIEKSSVLRDLTKEERKTLEALYPPAFFQKSHSAKRNDTRFLVETKGLVALVAPKEIRIIDVSQHGLRIEIDELTLSELAQLSPAKLENFRLQVRVADGRYANLRVKAHWSDLERATMGLAVVESDFEWARYIRHLNADFISAELSLA